MKKGIALILAAASAAAFAAPAMAQSADFTGPRVEAIVGYDTSRPGSSTDIDNAEDIDQSVDGVTYGVGVGYDFAVGGMILGLEGEWTESSAQSDYDTTDFTTFGVENVEVGRDFYVGARVGAEIVPGTLLYAKGGYTNARYNILATDNSTDVDSDIDLDGWRVGLGIEEKLSDNIYAKVEYRYSNYEEGEVEAPSGLESDRFNVDIDRHQVMAGLGVRF